MAKIAEILELEKDREGKQNIIHLIKEGSFYRAYEWSAWLVVTYCYTDEVRMATKDRKPLAVTKKRIKSSKTTFTFVGFPVTSLNKYIPIQSTFEPKDNEIIDITIDLPNQDEDKTKSFE